MRFVLMVVCVTVAAGLALCEQARADGRVGFAEEFDTVEGWKLTNPRAPLAGMSAAGGVATFRTWVGSFMGAKPPDQAQALPATTQIFKEYPGEVDLDKYRYLVMKIDRKSMYSILELNRKQVHVAYTTGVVAQDLKPLGLAGPQKLRIDLEMMNNGRELAADYIRLVSELTPQEKARLVPAPVRLYAEDIPGHLYQRLEALNARAGRIWRTGAEEKVAFRDVGTGALTWRMTAVPADEGYSERYRMWMPDGSAFEVLKGGRRTYVFDRDEFVRGGLDTLTPPRYAVNFYAGPQRGQVHVLRRNGRTGKMEVIFRYPKAGNRGLRSAIHGDRIVFLVAGVKLIVLDGTAADPAGTAREFPVPKLSVKGGGLSPDGRWFSYFSPFGCYQKTLVNTDTGEVRKGSQFTFTHGMGGRPWSIMSYGTAAKLQVSGRAFYGGNDRPGDALRLHGVYLDPVHTDYGAMTADGRYGYTNGLRGELAGQHVMFDGRDAGTILRLATYRVSKITWNVWTKTIASPDYTKLMYLSDMLGNSDYFMCIARLPDPPQRLAARRVTGGVKLTWDPPKRRAEIKGYNIYRSSTSGRRFRRINGALVVGNEFTDPAPADKAAYYLVAAREHSGLEGTFSREVCVDAAGPVRLHAEAERGRMVAPVREMFDGHAGGFRAARVAKVAMGEDEGELRIDTGIRQEGRYRGWARCRIGGADGGTLTIRRPKPPHWPTKLTVRPGPWRWVRSRGKMQLEPKADGATLVLASSDNGLAVDRIIVTDDDRYVPEGIDDRTAAPAPVKGLKVAEVTASSVSLAWNPADGPDVQHYSVYAGDDPDFKPGNETVICSTRKPAAVDWGVGSGRELYYKVVAVNRRGQASEPAAVKARTRAMDVFTAELPAAKARIAEGIRRGKDVDVEYVAGPDDGQAAATFEFEVPADGAYYLWAEYGARYGKGTKLPVRLDDRDGLWTTHQPTRMGRDTPGRRPRWFVHRMSASKRYRRVDLRTLTRGKHALTFTLSQRLPWISKVWVTNDPSYVPPGFSAQARLNRDRRQQRPG
ncbi:MAG: fibronectin type III domain-containing protein [Planctomycetota bacterium]|jgi:hypothetical protein